MYPPRPYHQQDKSKITELVKTYPFAHVFAPGGRRLEVTKLPLVYDPDIGSHGRIRGHLNRNNPLAEALLKNGATISFSGPDSYVSPSWRDPNGDGQTRAATWDYVAVHMWGTCEYRDDLEFFRQQIIDLTVPLEAYYSPLAGHPEWHYDQLSDEYINRLFPHIVAFEIQVEEIEATFKLHQTFSSGDAQCVANQLEALDGEVHKNLAKYIKDTL